MGFGQLSLKLSRTELSLPKAAIVRHSVRNENDRDVGPRDVVHNTSQKHTPEHEPRRSKSMGVRIPNGGAPLTMYRIPVTIRRHASEKEMRQGEGNSRRQMQERSPHPIPPLQRVPKSECENERSERSIGENLTELHAGNCSQIQPGIARAIQLVDGGSCSEGNEGPDSEAGCPNQLRTICEMDFRFALFLTCDRNISPGTANQFPSAVGTDAPLTVCTIDAECAIKGANIGVAVRPHVPGASF